MVQLQSRLISIRALDNSSRGETRFSPLAVLEGPIRSGHHHQISSSLVASIYFLHCVTPRLNTWQNPQI